MTELKQYYHLFLIRIPAAGFFNKDDIPDFLVRYNYGAGFPVYFYSNVSLFVQHSNSVDGCGSRGVYVYTVKAL